MTVVVSILLATICFTKAPDAPQECHNALIGAATPRGEYTLQQRLVESPGYGGDVLQFKEDSKDGEIFAIHRVWLLRPWEHREQRIKSKDPKVRHITKGCINVEPAVYAELVDCCSNQKLIIQ